MVSASELKRIKRTLEAIEPALEVPCTPGDHPEEGMNASHGSMGREVVRERAALETYQFLLWKILPVGKKTERETKVAGWQVGNDWWVKMVITFVERGMKRSLTANFWRSQENAQFGVIKINSFGGMFWFLSLFPPLYSWHYYRCLLSPSLPTPPSPHPHPFPLATTTMSVSMGYACTVFKHSDFWLSKNLKKDSR